MSKHFPRDTVRVQEAADRLGIHYTAVKQAIERGELEAVLADGKVFVLVDTLHRYKPRAYGDRRKENDDG
jgi:excisionase family DNA binding protein